MKPREFFDRVAEPSADACIHENDDLRLAVNAILTLDAFFGILHAHLKAAGDTQACSKRYDEYRDGIAAGFREYRILRDTAFALKHGELTGKKPRLVSRSGQMGGRAPVLGEMGLDEDPLGGGVIFVDGIAAGPSERGEFLAAQVAGFIRGLLTQHGL